MDTTGPNATFDHGRSMRCERHVAWPQLFRVADAVTLLGTAVLTVKRLGERPRLVYSLPAKCEGDTDFSRAFCA